MAGNVDILEVKSLTNEMKDELSGMLRDVVDQDASIGFLPPLDNEAAGEYWSGVLKSGVILWVCKVEDTICGTIQLHLAQQQNGSHRAEVAKLMVHPTFRRFGIGRTLMQTLEERAKAEGRTLLVLDTRAGDPSNRLYQSLGYIEAGRIPNYAISADGSLHETVLYYKNIS